MSLLIIPQLLNKILKTKDLKPITKNGLDRTYFTGYEKEFDFIFEHWAQYGNVPDIETMLSAFPNFMLIDVNETDEYLLEQLYEEHTYQQFLPVPKKLDELLKVDSREAYDYLENYLQKIKPHSICTGTDIISKAEERYEAYEYRSKHIETATIKSGLKELDDIFGGWEFGEELVTVVARTNMGKSWLLLKFLAEAWKQGKRVGLYSGEMSSIKLGYRFDALFNHFSNRCLTIGVQQDSYKEYINTLKNNPTPLNIITPREFKGRPTVQKLRAYIEANELDILGIDQYSLMEDGRSNVRDPLRLKLAHIAEDLFLCSCDYKIPIIGLAQANRAGVNKDEQDQAPGLENIKESDDIAHNSSKAIGMRQSSFGLILDVIKNREGKVGDKLLYNWDIDNGYFSYIPSSGDAVAPEVRQQHQDNAAKQVAENISINPF